MECPNCAERPEIPAEVSDALRHVRDIRKADMYARETVIHEVSESGAGDAHRWLTSNRHLYFHALDAVHEEDDQTAVVRAA